MPIFELEVSGKTYEVEAPDMDAAIRAANDLQLGDAARNQERVEQAHSIPDREIRAGSILPLTNLDGNVDLDLSVGLPGAIARAAMLPGDVYQGNVQLRGPDGQITNEAMGRIVDLAGFSPAGVAARAAIPASQSARSMARQAAQRNVDDASEFGVDLSRGQATRDFNTQAFEEDALTGGRGSGAQRAVAGQREAQREQVRAATENIQDRMAPSRVDDPFEAAESVGQAVATEAARRKAASQAAYDAAENMGGELAPEAVQGLSGRMRAVLDDAGAMEGVAVAPDMPNVRRIMGRIDDLSNLRNAPPGDVVGIGWPAVERIRKQINKTKASGEEGRILGLMRRDMDEWLQQSIDDGLVSGSPKFIDALRSARGLWSQFKNIDDNPQTIIRRMANREADSVEIANWIYGASKLGGNTKSAKVVREIKKIIGPDHPEYVALKRNILNRLFDDVRAGDVKTYGRLAGDINEFLNARGRDLAREMFTKAERRELGRFAEMLRNLTPQSTATNPSRSGQTVMRRLSDQMNKLAPMFGLAVGDLTGMLAGFGFAAGASGRNALRARGIAQNPIPPQGRISSNRSAQVPTNAGFRGLVIGLTPQDVENAR